MKQIKQKLVEEDTKVYPVFKFQNEEGTDKDPSEVILRKRDLKASQKGRVNLEKLIFEHEKKKVCSIS